MEQIIIKLSPHAKFVEKENRLGVLYEQRIIWAQDDLQQLLLKTIANGAISLTDLCDILTKSFDEPQADGYVTLILAEFILDFEKAIEEYLE